MGEDKGEREGEDVGKEDKVGQGDGEAQGVGAPLPLYEALPLELREPRGLSLGSWLGVAEEDSVRPPKEALLEVDSDRVGEAVMHVENVKDKILVNEGRGEDEGDVDTEVEKVIKRVSLEDSDEVVEGV